MAAAKTVQKTPTKASKPKKKLPADAPAILAAFVVTFLLSLYLAVFDFENTIFAGLGLDDVSASISNMVHTWDFSWTSPKAAVTYLSTTIVCSGIYVVLVQIYKFKQAKAKAAALEANEPKKKTVYPAWVRPVSIVHFTFLTVLSLAMAVGIFKSYFGLCAAEGWDVCLNLHSEAGAEASHELWVGAGGFWIWVFAASKYYEFGDTFIMMGKSYDLIFLHWWHHATVPILMTVHATEHSAASWTGSWFNCVVHTVMYAYYTVNTIGYPLAAIKPLVTALQLAQFVTVLGHIIWLNFQLGFAAFPLTFFAAYTVYGSYLVLFLQFFVKSYMPKKQKKKIA